MTLTYTRAKAEQYITVGPRSRDALALLSAVHAASSHMSEMSRPSGGTHHCPRENVQDLS